MTTKEFIEVFIDLQNEHPELDITLDILDDYAEAAETYTYTSLMDDLYNDYVIEEDEDE